MIDLKHLRLFSNWILRKGFISNTYNQLLKNPKSIDLKHLRVFSNRTDAQQSKYCKIGLVSNNLSVQFLGELGKDPCKNLYIFCRNWQRNNFPKMMRFYCFIHTWNNFPIVHWLTDWLYMMYIIFCGRIRSKYSVYDVIYISSSTWLWCILSFVAALDAREWTFIPVFSDPFERLHW